ncbi:exosortase system-associated protein, TIGR04073 family [Nitrosomonas sp. HPC101]|uniref:exosortase system-associated protein, TIGR04073 family n=1 Tax=Nitrosomonas sp. HPC101 TaxID=1658667 RepID=UPI001371190F|nr:exosortase system-associated protein, TIGR04073 family [Nitrosomonas sp. HPC101]MXS86358.1 exosortase system-associated protein, TIGR04073 family [Nitrosomonas sp. HPC101]
MKTVIIRALFLMAFCVLPQTVIAQRGVAQSYPAAASEKLVNGIVNVATGFVELPKNVILTSQQDGAGYGLTIGLVTGIMHTIGRTVFGALDAITFLIPTQPTVRPPYIWQDFNKETTYG